MAVAGLGPGDLADDEPLGRDRNRPSVGPERGQSAPRGRGPVMRETPAPSGVTGGRTSGQTAHRLATASLDFHGRVFSPSDETHLLGNPLFHRISSNRALAVSMTDLSRLSVLSRSQTLCFKLDLRSWHPPPMSISP